MKLLFNEEFERLNALLCVSSGDRRIVGRMESYSCKATTQDKKFFKEFIVGGEDGTITTVDSCGDRGNSNNCTGNIGTSVGICARSNMLDQPLSPPQTIISPFGPFQLETCSKKTLYYLIATLNASFPDYDFSRTKSTHFSKEPSVDMVANYIDNTLLSALGVGEFSLIKPAMWSALNDDIQLNQCDVYSYLPEMDSDPFGVDGGALWAFHYFFYNKKIKRIILFTCRCMSSSAEYQDDEVEDESYLLDDEFMEMNT